MMDALVMLLSSGLAILFGVWSWRNPGFFKSKWEQENMTTLDIFWERVLTIIILVPGVWALSMFILKKILIEK